VNDPTAHLADVSIRAGPGVRRGMRSLPAHTDADYSGSLRACGLAILQYRLTSSAFAESGNQHLALVAAGGVAANVASRSCARRTKRGSPHRKRRGIRITDEDPCRGAKRDGILNELVTRVIRRARLETERVDQPACRRWCSGTTRTTGEARRHHGGAGHRWRDRVHPPPKEIPARQLQRSADPRSGEAARV
jgi:hypothetical protein